MAKAKRASKQSQDTLVSQKDQAVKPVEDTEAKKVAIDDSVIDDPVRMYLMQMGRIPLLTREEEVASAKQIEHTRFKFRNHMLATDFMLRGVYDALQKVFNGELNWTVRSRFQ